MEGYIDVVIDKWRDRESDVKVRTHKSELLRMS